jgi:hypothetical protein
LGNKYKWLMLRIVTIHGKVDHYEVWKSFSDNTF